MHDAPLNLLSQWSVNPFFKISVFQYFSARASIYNNYSHACFSVRCNLKLKVRKYISLMTSKKKSRQMEGNLSSSKLIISRIQYLYKLLFTVFVWRLGVRPCGWSGPGWAGPGPSHVISSTVA